MEKYKVTLAADGRYELEPLVRKRFVTESLEQAIHPRRQPRRPDKIKLDKEAQRQWVKLACSDPPDGRGYWGIPHLPHMISFGKLLDSSVGSC